MMKAKTGMLKLSSIYISHLHADHVLGIPGLLQTMAFQGRTEQLKIYGPKGIIEFMYIIEKIFTTKLKYKLLVKQLNKNEIIYEKMYMIKAVPTNHNIESYGYIFQEYKKLGRFNKEKAEKLGIPKGPLYSKLHKGEKVVLENGMVIDPYHDGIVGKQRDGFKMAYSGDTRED